ncbi:OadG family protein [Pseudomonas sp.]|jgi:oxaloacetate decarboxylase (Na+ extruding) subunit gamma|uniref:OadG family protein n=1 Tax=Pseudomonas sp. TaxID=306 RepID=UPI00272D1917|nr:OadG family protein [Pseudomonas sp.]
MNSTELLMEGVELMALGMGSVFVFLILLVVVTTLMSKVLGRYFPEAAPAPKPAPRSAAAPAAAVDPEILAVIGAAIKQHRDRRRS